MNSRNQVTQTLRQSLTRELLEYCRDLRRCEEPDDVLNSASYLRAVLARWRRQHQGPDERYGGYIVLHSGRKFWPLDPRPEEIEIEDVAWGLAHTTRYGGHANGPYTVAQHACYVSQTAEELMHQWAKDLREGREPDSGYPHFPFAEFSLDYLGTIATEFEALVKYDTPERAAYEALHHDDSEGLGLGDMVAPVKKFMLEYQDAEEVLTLALAKRFGFIPVEATEYIPHATIKFADERVARTEMRDIHPKCGEHCRSEGRLRHVAPLPWTIDRIWTAEEAAEKWLERHFALQRRVYG